MRLLATFLGPIGAPGAAANAAEVLRRREQEDWLVAGLAHRLAQRDRELAARRSADVVAQPAASG